MARLDSERRPEARLADPGGMTMAGLAGPSDVDAVVLNYRAAALAIEAARSARENGAGSVCVVDNHSEDGSVPVLRGEVGDFAGIVPMPENVGFAAGNNRGAREGGRPFILFMNADARLHDGALAGMLQAFEDDRVGAVVPALCFPDGRPQASAYFFISPTRIANELLGFHKLAARLGCSFLCGNVDPRRNGDYSGTVESAYGSCFLVRRDAFESLGGFDEAFFLYCEETEFFLRLTERGWLIHRAAQALVTHNHGESAKTEPLRSYVVMQESLQIYSRKHFGLLGRALTFAASVAGFGLRFALASGNADRRRYWAALGAWLGWTESADPRKHGAQAATTCNGSAPPTENSSPRRGDELPTPSPGGRASVPSEGALSGHGEIC